MRCRCPFVGELLGRTSPRGQRLGIHLLFGTIALVIAGSMLGEWAGMLQWLPRTWFWFGNQGSEYLEIGRFWQIQFALGLLFCRPAGYLASLHLQRSEARGRPCA
jgi:nitric oxide reductase subunit B